MTDIDREKLSAALCEYRKCTDDIPFLWTQWREADPESYVKNATAISSRGANQHNTVLYLRHRASLRADQGMVFPRLFYGLSELCF